jgi:uncharacterized protein YkwD
MLCMGPSNASPGRLSRASLVTAASATIRLFARGVRALAVATSLTFVFMVCALLSVAGGAEAHAAHHPGAHRLHRGVKSYKGHGGHRRRHRKHRVVHPSRRTRSGFHSGRVSPQEAAVVSGARPCPNVNVVPNASNIPVVVQATLCLINQQRRTHGVPALTEDTRLDRAAQAHTNDMVGHGYFEHVSPSGSSPLQRMLAAGYLRPADGYQVGENIAWGTLNLATPASIVNDWMHSEGHRANILDRGFRNTGMGIAPAVPGNAAGNQPGATYTQDFGTVLR